MNFSICAFCRKNQSSTLGKDCKIHEDKFNYSHYIPPFAPINTDIKQNPKPPFFEKSAALLSKVTV